MTYAHVAHVETGAFMIMQLGKNNIRRRSLQSSRIAKPERVSSRDFRQRYILALDLAFDSRSLRTICEKEEETVREFGLSVAEVLKHRLADLRAAKSINDLVVGYPQVLDGTNNQQMAINLPDDYQVIFCANHPNNPVLENGFVDWSKVSRIKILQIRKNNVKRQFST
jgi:plasmid maintenance system killer protein